MTWNYNIDEAPRGRTEARTRKDNNGRDIKYEVFRPDRVITASHPHNGEPGVVTLSYWMPKDNRWNMYATGEVPMAWMPWPDYPPVKP